MTPTPLGEGKTITAVGSAQGSEKIGHAGPTAVDGPNFRNQGQAAGAGYSQVLMEKLNLHLTGDFHAIERPQPACRHDRQPSAPGQRVSDIEPRWFVASRRRYQ